MALAANFAVAEGTLTVHAHGEERVVRAGESLLVPAGTPHKPFNEMATTSITVNSIPKILEVAPELHTMRRCRRSTAGVTWTIRIT